MDHYKVLGLARNASKEEIKESFRKLAMQFHPDKHSQSPETVKQDAILRFKQVSEAYEVLIDDRKRADYTIRSYSNNYNSNYGQRGAGTSGGYGYSYYGDRTHKYSYRRPPPSYGDGGFFPKFEDVLRYMTTRAFLLNLAFAGVLLGGSVVFEWSGQALWKRHNSGKSFEEAMHSIEKAKADNNKV